MCARRGWKNSGESKAIRAAAGDDDRRVHTQGEGERPRELARAGRERVAVVAAISSYLKLAAKDIPGACVGRSA